MWRLEIQLFKEITWIVLSQMELDFLKSKFLRALAPEHCQMGSCFESLNVWNYKTHDEFESGWNWEDLLTTHELKENEWVKPFYDIQHMDTSIC